MNPCYRLLLTLFCLGLLALPQARAGLVNLEPQDSLSLKHNRLTLGYTLSPPFLYQHNARLSGPSYWLWEQVAEGLNLHYTLVELPHDSLIIALSEGKVDASLSPLTITSERLENMEFSVPFHIIHSSIMAKRSSGFHGALQFILSFFSMGFIQILLGLALLIFVFGYLVYFFESRGNPEEFSKGFKGVWDGFWWSAVTMTTVGYGDKSPKTTGGRIIALVWMFTAVTVISGFTASIASALTVDKIGASINSMEDFKDKKLGSITASATENWLKSNFYNNRQSYPNRGELAHALYAGEVDAIAFGRPYLQEIAKIDSMSNYPVMDIKYNPQFFALGLNRALPHDLKHKISLSISQSIESQEWKILLSEHKLN